MKRRLTYILPVMLLAAAMLFAAGCSGEVKYDSSEFLDTVPEWDGEHAYCEINGNVPDFKKDEIWTSTQESLDQLDSLGRCGTANSCIGPDGMPEKERGDISEIHPTGWHSTSYEEIGISSLYNRCHLIAYKLSGDDAVDRNLITGTSYMNQVGMDGFENDIAAYVKETGNHVMYRVEPCFKGDELVARGVHMQAVSVEDGGEGISFNVFCYNVQPSVEIDYATGDSKLTEKAADPDPDGDGKVTYVLNTYRKKFHYEYCQSAIEMNPDNKEVVETTRDELIAQGYTPCGSCKP